MLFTFTPLNEGINEESRLRIYDYGNKAYYLDVIIKKGEKHVLNDREIAKSPNSFKYKYQTKKDDKWVDATKYTPLVPTPDNKLEKFLTEKITMNTKELEELIESVNHSPTDETFSNDDVYFLFHKNLLFTGLSFFNTSIGEGK